MTEKRKNELDKASVPQGRLVFQTRLQGFPHFGPGLAEDPAGVSEKMRAPKRGDKCPVSGAFQV